MSPDAFSHLPALRERVTPPLQSELRVTPQVMAFWDERARLLGRPANWRLTDEQLEASRRDLLGACDNGRDLWVYSYGSLMWDPGFHFDEIRLAELPGHRRRFSYRATVGRGSPQQPGLMLSLEAGPGACQGLAFRIAGARVDAESAIVWRREMVRGGYCPALLAVATPQGELTALVFAANRAHPDHVGELSLAETAAIIARASGPMGTNRAYLEQLAEQLCGLGIEDPYVTQLRALVASCAPAVPAA